jgi:hypothetical protein
MIRRCNNIQSNCKNRCDFAIIQLKPYYTSSGATTANSAELIPVLSFTTTPSIMKVWARVRNTNGCFSVAELTLKVWLHKFQIHSKERIQNVTISSETNNSNNKRDGVTSLTLVVQQLL